jgi:Fic family protein
MPLYRTAKRFHFFLLSLSHNPGLNMTNIEKLYKEWRAAQPINETLKHRMDQQFMIDFNYNSNHLEGNTLTYGQTELLLIFGKVSGEANMRDLEEMKAHNAGFEWMKIEALDRERPLSESFIRELNRIILAGDYYKTSRDGEYRYKIHVGVYKTRPNSVITATGEFFEYASPEETPALMADLVKWYNEAEQNQHLSPVELAALFHYRYIRIHPFEDGNGRIARLIVNYVLLRHGYPMIIIPTADRRNYLDALGQTDAIVGKMPFEGANATLKQITPFFNYISKIVEKKLQFAKDLIDGKLDKFEETDKTKDVSVNSIGELGVKLGVKLGANQIEIIKHIQSNNYITFTELSKNIGISEVAIHKNIKKLKEHGILTREGSDKTGFWKIPLG